MANEDEILDFNVKIPKPFSLKRQSAKDIQKIREEVMDKVMTWESRMGKFFEDYTNYTDSWRIKPIARSNKRPKGLFNSKSGETHRGVETIATVWQRMLTAADPYFEAVKGLMPDGQRITSQDLFNTESVLREQLNVLDFKKKLLRTLRSLAGMGMVIVELPYISLPFGNTGKVIEYTDFVFRPLIRTGFDMTVYDVKQSDYIFTIDFFSKWMLRNSFKVRVSRCQHTLPDCGYSFNTSVSLTRL